jgi:hypothetical protein
MTINVRGLANGAIQVVNANIAATYYASTGAATDAAGKRTPSYAAGVAIQIQAQAAKGSDLKHVNNLNMQDVYKNVRMWGDAQGVVRPDAKGGDLLTFPNVPAGTVHTWLVVAVLETWPDWCSVVACLQTDPALP